MTEPDSEPGSERDPSREVESTGETVGEAKWAAVRALEQRFPGLDKAGVEFVVISEGERGLLGIGFAPARVMARVAGRIHEPRPSDSSEQEPRPSPRSKPLTPAGERLQELLGLVRDALGLDASIDIREDVGSLTGTFQGRDLGLVIGKRGQTIDAVQSLAAAVSGPRAEGESLEVAVDAAGYRDRRRSSLEAAADRAAARVRSSGNAVELEPMSAAERKVIHLYLKDHADVTTESTGSEPYRHVVVQPRL